MNRNRKTIIIVENSIGFTGAFKAIFQTAEDLSTYYRFVFIVPRGSTIIKDLEHAKLSYYQIKYYPLRRSLVNLFLYLPYLLFNAIKIISICKKEKSRIVHSNDLYNLAPLLAKILTFNKIKVIAHVRFLKYSFPTLIFNLWVTLNKLIANKIISLSVVASQPFNGASNLVVINDRIPLKERLPYKYDPDQNLNSIIYLSNYIPGKGQDLALDAFEIILKELPNSTLTFVGGDLGLRKNKEFKEYLIQKAKSITHSGIISFKDFAADIEPEIKSHQILLNLSRFESFSFTCMEALTYGVPCISTASGGPQELLENGKYGIIVKERDPEFIAKETIKLILDKNRRVELSLLGRVYVRNKFSIENTSYKTLEIYNEFN